MLASKGPEFLLPPISTQRKEGSEPVHRSGRPLGPTLLDFWQWSSSNLLDNILRGTLAEWLVACALGCAQGARQEWGSYDLMSPSGIRVEVKSAAYIQSWAQRRYSTITFSVREAYAWDPESNSYAAQQARLADVYVFCLLAHRDQETIVPMDVAQWRFYVVPTHELNRQLVHQKGISLARWKTDSRPGRLPTTTWRPLFMPRPPKPRGPLRRSADPGGTP